jgi:hypothetical protein
VAVRRQREDSAGLSDVHLREPGPGPAQSVQHVKPIESAIKPVIYSEQFANDITRIVAKVIHPRQKVVLDEEMIRKNLTSRGADGPGEGDMRN